MPTVTHPTIDQTALLAADPDQWVEQYGDLLLGYAVRHVADRATAEDLVQETFLAAWQSRARYRGEAKFETWLIGILQRKACDHFRAKGREASSLDEASTRTASDAAAPMFDRRGHWKTRPERWSRLPADAVESEEFWSVVQHCLDDLPDHFAAAFRQRVASEGSLQQISTALGISCDNLSVRLHRARLLLRKCLTRNWFEERTNGRGSRKA